MPTQAFTISHSTAVLASEVLMSLDTVGNCQYTSLLSNSTGKYLLLSKHATALDAVQLRIPVSSVSLWKPLGLTVPALGSSLSARRGHSLMLVKQACLKAGLALLLS